MTPPKTSLLFALFAFTSFLLTTNALCLRNVDGHIFNLCPFDSPFNISYNALPYWAANLTFGLARANAPSCNSTTPSWMYAVSKECYDNKTEPVFSFTSQTTSVPGLKIDYILDPQSNITVNLFCNQTAPHDANINFFVAGVFNDAMEIYGYSYYGCPVKAADNNRFLSF